MILVSAAELDPSIAESVNAAASAAYERVAADESCLPEDVPYMQRCMAVSALILDRLESGGYEGRVQPLILPLGNVNLSHFYVRLMDPHGELSIDGTWQQFLRREQLSPKLPKVLIARGSNIIGLAAGYGVSERFHQIWHPNHWRLPHSTSASRLTPY